MSDNYEPSPWEPIADHVQQYLDTDGEQGGTWEGAPIIVLSTTGAKSGKLRRTPLIRVKAGEDYLVIASMGGAPSHPNWYHNIVAHPEVTVQDHAEVHEMIARTATESERAELWPAAAAVWPAYDEYVTKTDRVIPLVICSPR